MLQKAGATVAGNMKATLVWAATEGVLCPLCCSIGSPFFVPLCFVLLTYLNIISPSMKGTRKKKG